MTQTYYLHNGQLFEIDRMPPEKPNPANYRNHEDGTMTRSSEAQYNADCHNYSCNLHEFHSYLSTLEPIPHTFSGESRVIPPNQIEWRYEINDLLQGWISASKVVYDACQENDRRRIAIPKITEGGKKSNKFPWEKHMKDDETCVPSNEDLYALEGEPLNESYGYTSTSATSPEPLTAQPDKQRVEMPEWFSWQQVDFLISKFVCDFAPQHSTVESPGQFIKRGVEHPHFPSPPSSTPEQGDEEESLLDIAKSMYESAKKLLEKLK